MKYSVVQIQVVRRLCSEVIWLEYDDINDFKPSIARLGGEEKSSVFAFVRIPFVH
ncbi:MAG: hypothetical protein OXG10_04745 [Candidatus Dadabacteria bacterium]|nr:hypothetical protein [Candidatus Dadabacteria bacterium]